MKKIDIFEKAIETRENPKDTEINYTLFRAYRESREAENELPDFSEVVWENEIPDIVRACRELGIEAFTISSTFSGLLAVFAAFEQEGCKLQGLTEINSRFSFLGARERIPAMRFSL